MTECVATELKCNALGTFKVLKIKGFRAVVNRGADTFYIWHLKRPSNGTQRRYKSGRWTPIAEYLRKDTKLLPYLPYPRFLLDADLTQTAKVLYAVLLDRANLSRANGWMDEDGNTYIVFPIDKVANMVDKGPSTVKNALNELETAGLIERRRCGNRMPNRIYVKQPDSQEIARLTDKKPVVRWPENWPADSQKVGPQTARKLASNKISSNLKNNLSRVSERTLAVHGRYQNVFMSDMEIAELQAELPDLWQQYVEKLSEYMASTGKTYKNHAATIRRWAAEDRHNVKNLPDYTYKEGESL